MAYNITLGRFYGPPLGTVETYTAGTLTPLATYTTSAGTVANPTTIDIPASGYVPIWGGDGLSYRFIVKDADGATVYDQDNITASGGDYVSQTDYDTFVANLADDASDVTGAGLVGYDPTIDYATGTIGHAANAQGRVLQGADPTGGVDATAKFRTLLDYCIAAGLKAVIPAGTYLVSGPLSDPAPIASGSLEIECAGPVTINVNAASAAFVSVLTCYTAAANTCKITGPLTINCENKAANGVYVRHLGQGGSAYIDRVTVNDAKNTTEAAENQGLVVSGRYFSVSLSNIYIDGVDRTAPGTACKGITVDLIEGVGSLSNITVKNVKSTGFTGDADGIYLGGYTSGAAYSQRSGQYWVENVHIEDCQGRSFKGQHQNIRIRGMRILRQAQATFDLADVDFQLGGGDVDGLEFVYQKSGGSSLLDANFYPIAIQQQCTDRRNQFVARRVMFRAEMQVIRLANVIVGASALDGVVDIEGVELQPLGAMSGSHFSRCVLEFDAGQVAASTGKTHLRLCRTRGDLSSIPLLGHVSFGASVASKLSWDVTYNHNTGTIGANSKVIYPMSGSAIPQVSSFMCRDNTGIIDMMMGLGGGAGTGWTFDYQSLPVGCRFHYDIASANDTNAPGAMAATGVAFVEVLGHAYDTSTYRTIRVTVDNAAGANTVFYTQTGTWGAIK